MVFPINIRKNSNKLFSNNNIGIVDKQMS